MTRKHSLVGLKTALCFKSQKNKVTSIITIHINLNFALFLHDFYIVVYYSYQIKIKIPSLMILIQPALHCIFLDLLT